MVTSAISVEAENDECFLVRHGLRELWPIKTFLDPLNQYVVLGIKRATECWERGRPRPHRSQTNAPSLKVVDTSTLAL